MASGQEYGRFGSERGGAMMEQQRNKELVLRFYKEVWNEGRYEFATELFATNQDGRRVHGAVGPNSGEIQARIAEGFRSLFPDVQLNVEYILAEGELVAARWRATATHALTGKKIVDYTAVNIWKFRDGKAIEINNNRDDLTVFHQLGLIPSREELFSKVGRGDYKYSPTQE
jgi:predicted SnoaL-like aldol condensation-catalyzing enzyme